MVPSGIFWYLWYLLVPYVIFWYLLASSGTLWYLLVPSTSIFKGLPNVETPSKRRDTLDCQVLSGKSQKTRILINIRDFSPKIMLSACSFLMNYLLTLIFLNYADLLNDE
jgi:hypothetical protein